MKKVKWFTLAILITIISVISYKYYYQTSQVISLKNDITKMEQILSKDKLGASDKQFLKQIQDNNWDLISSGKLSDKQQLHYVLLEDKTVDDINSYFAKKNLNTKETIQKQIDEIKKYYNLK